VLESRFGGDLEQLQKQLAQLHPVRDRILDNARIRVGDALLDVGAGDGMVSFGAARRVGRSGRVIFSDISPELVERCREIALEVGGEAQFEFVIASAHDLAPVEDASVDVVTTRSVLIYVEDKDAALRAFTASSGQKGVSRSLSRSTSSTPTGVPIQSSGATT
jgi:arsenite methyltransferase